MAHIFCKTTTVFAHAKDCLKMEKSTRAISLFCTALQLVACSAEEELSDSQINFQLPELRRSIQAIDPGRLSVVVNIDGGTSREAQRTSNGNWILPALERADFGTGNHNIFIRWTMETETTPTTILLLAEYSGQFTLNGASSSVTPTGNFETFGDQTFDIDNDGVSNLAEVTSDPASDPRATNSIPLPKMQSIPGGCFDLGSPDTEADRLDPEGPQQFTCVDAFSIGVHEVTFAQYDAFASATNRALPNDQGWGRGTRPVVSVDWSDANAYTEWLSNRTGQQYRLPTEAEWEFAARAGTATPYLTGQTISVEQANFGDTRDRTLPVASFTSANVNSFALLDIIGNVWEMTCSGFYFYTDNVFNICSGLSSSDTRVVIRGCSYSSSRNDCRSARRGGIERSERFNDVGFRVVLQ